ncbi:DUF3237 family protein [Bradyrhizobium sp. USDA 10063]
MPVGLICRTQNGHIVIASKAKQSIAPLVETWIASSLRSSRGDWYRPGADGFGRPNVRVQFITDDDAVILLHYTGLVQMNDAFTKAAEAGGTTRFEDHYMRMAMRFDTGAPKYAWLN